MKPDWSLVCLRQGTNNTIYIMKLISYLLSVSLLLFAGSCDKTETDDINVEVEILKEMEARHIPSVVAGVVKGDRLVWEGAFGFADVANSKPATNQSLYTLMSITKLFISTAVMQLWEKGVIDLDADINRYLPFEVHNPNFPDKMITSHMLLTHTSSLAWPEETDRLSDFHHFYTNEDPPLISEWLPEYILPTGEQYRSSVWKPFPPGEKSLYSNIATTLMALIVENIAEADFRDYCQENILEPLEMHNSAFRFSNLNKELLATPYTKNNSPILPYTSRHYPAGFLFTNMEDFSHYMIALLNQGEFNGKRILQKTSIEKMLVVQNPESGHGLLWANCIGDCVGKKGGGTGGSTWAEWHFDRERGMFLFSNKENEMVYPGRRIYELVKYQCYKY